MLPARHRMRRREDFAAAVRGRRCSTRHLVVHLGRGERSSTPVVGFVVPRAVGGAVQRNTVKRRLRALMRNHLDGLPAGSLVVVRALPAAAGVRSAELSEDLASAVTAVTQPRPTQPRRGRRPR